MQWYMVWYIIGIIASMFCGVVCRYSLLLVWYGMVRYGVELNGEGAGRREEKKGM